MSPSEISQSVLSCVGGRNNVFSNSLCMTRLRLRLNDIKIIDAETLKAIPGVLGLAKRGKDGLEVVFGPRLAQDIYKRFIELTGCKSHEAESTNSSPLTGALSVTISPGKKRSFEAQQELNTHHSLSHLASGSIDEVDDLAGLGKLFEQEQASRLTSQKLDGLRLLVINGPNINMLGIREPKIYGKQTYDDLLSLCKQVAADEGFAECTCFQSNHEGDIVDRIQDAYSVYNGIIINPGAYTHTSIAILDALKSVGLPTIEVHLSKVDKREDFRQISYVRPACFKTIIGKGIDGYREAIKDMAKYFLEHKIAS